MKSLHFFPLLAALSVMLTAAQPDGPAWRVLDGPEKEKGDAVRIIENSNGNLTVSVNGRRGTVMRGFPPTSLPATVEFRFQSNYDSKAREHPTELYGTGDFRIFVGTRGAGEASADLGAYEGFQFRVFPHLDESPIRIKTGDESHTATSLWIRYVDPKRRLDGLGLPHTGLLSDAGQNRNKQKGIHNSGWARVALHGGGFGLRNGQETVITIHLSRKACSIEAEGKRFSHPLKPDEHRVSTIDTIAIGHTNISRGYQTYRVSNLHVASQLK